MFPKAFPPMNTFKFTSSVPKKEVLQDHGFVPHVEPTRDTTEEETDIEGGDLCKSC